MLIGSHSKHVISISVSKSEFKQARATNNSYPTPLPMPCSRKIPFSIPPQLYRPSQSAASPSFVPSRPASQSCKLHLPEPSPPQEPHTSSIAATLMRARSAAYTPHEPTNHSQARGESRPPSNDNTKKTTYKEEPRESGGQKKPQMAPQNLTPPEKGLREQTTYPQRNVDKEKRNKRHADKCRSRCWSTAANPEERVRTRATVFFLPPGTGRSGVRQKQRRS